MMLETDLDTSVNGGLDTENPASPKLNIKHSPKLFDKKLINTK